MRFVVLAGLVGCYSPTFKPGAPCETDRDCPSALRCVANTCGGTQDMIADASPADVRVSDTTMPDAMVDALVTVQHVIGDDGAEIRDTEIWGDTNTINSNFGDYDHMSVDDADHSLVWFDLTSIDSNLTVYAATLRLRVTNFASDGTLTIHRLREEWSESEATFLSRVAGQAWSAAGAGPPASDATPVASLVPSSLDTDYDVELPVDLVQDWLSSPNSNYGIIIRRGTATEHVHFGVRDAGNGARLTIEVY